MSEQEQAESVAASFSAQEKRRTRSAATSATADESDPVWMLHGAEQARPKNMLQLINGIRLCFQTSDSEESDYKISKE
jgi:hypothetical protein|eukprot:COSAG01_NODE_54326_length_332_cov_8.064378_2_plen_78_part_00